MTKYDIFVKKHKAAKTVAEQKSLLKDYLLGLSSEELIQWYMETPDIIEKNLKQLIALEGEKGRQEASEYLATTISTLESQKTFVKAAA
jgi:hypothetical protein